MHARVSTWLASVGTSTVLNARRLDPTHDTFPWPDESVHCCITSPPYWGLRAYEEKP